MSSAEQTIYAVTPSLKSFVVEYDIEILLALTFIWTAALVLIWTFARQKKPELRYD
jgi:hypothetical protein